MTAGAALDHVVEGGVLLTRPTDLAGMTEEYATWFSDLPPARSVAKLSAEPPGVLISIRMTASVGQG